jgi:hypothetical protein
VGAEAHGLSEPLNVTAGDTWSWTRQESTYLPSAGYSLKYILQQLGNTPVEITTTGSGGTFTVSVPATTTAGIAAGSWKWTAIATKGAERYTVESGMIVVAPDPAQVTASTDTRTHAEKCLAAIRAVLAKKMAEPIVEYEIDGVKAKHLPHGELMKLEAIYAARVRRERGAPLFYRIPVRLNR